MNIDEDLCLKTSNYIYFKDRKTCCFRQLKHEILNEYISLDFCLTEKNIRHVNIYCLFIIFHLSILTIIFDVSSLKPIAFEIGLFTTSKHRYNLHRLVKKTRGQILHGWWCFIPFYKKTEIYPLNSSKLSNCFIRKIHRFSSIETNKIHTKSKVKNTQMFIIIKFFLYYNWNIIRYKF